MGAAAESLFTAVFPCNCRFCDSPLVRISRIPVCDACLDSIRALDEPVCDLCGQRLLAAQPDGARCPACIPAELPFSRAVAYGSYEGGLRDLIHLLKYERVRPAAAVLGRMLAEAVATLTSQFGPASPLVVPVPLHEAKQRQRGFNQSELIAHAMLKHLPAWRLKLNVSALRRRRATTSQTGLSRPQRRLNVRGAFEVERPNEIAGRDILLVDDVFTTGTTVAECARVLGRSAAGRVWVGTVARVLKPEANYSVAGEAEDGKGAVTVVARLARAAQA